MKRIPTLDGWRAVAITMVVVCHLGECFYPQPADYAMSPALYGAFGVDIFFGLSGLLITRLLLEEFRLTGSFHLARFYWRRAFRILPAYFAFLIAFTIWGVWQSGWEVASCLLFFRNYVPEAVAGRGTQHLWSLSVEEHFYLFWPGFLVWLGVRRAKNWPAYLALSLGLWRIVDSQLATPLFPGVFYRFRTDLRLDALLWGCAVAFLLDNRQSREKLTKQLPFAGWLAVAGIIAVSMKYFTPLTSIMIATLIPFLLAGTLLHPGWLLSRVLDSGPVVWLGRMSYSLYLWQAIFLIPAWEHPQGWWHLWPANLILSVLAATACHYLVEKPCIRLGQRAAERFSAAAAREVDAASPVAAA